MLLDYFNAQSNLKVAGKTYTIFQLDKLEEAGFTQLSRLPYSIRILLESVLRQCNEKEVTRQDVLNLASWQPKATQRAAMPYLPGRVLLQDLTGVPVINDLAAMRAAMQRIGGNPAKINPAIPVDLVIDHSLHVDYYGTADAFQRNAQIEFQRNRERYEFLHWGQKTFKNLRVIPPATGIVHQVNLEYLAQVVLTKEIDYIALAFPDTLVGTDSHTTMINGIGVLGWGVGGIEAIAAMLEQPVDMLIPDVIGFKLTGQLPKTATPTDLTLTIVQILRKKGVVEKFIEFYGPGLSSLPVADRAMIANMSPENGATLTYFPIDEQTLDFLRLTGRSDSQVALVEAYCKTQHLFRSDNSPDPEFTDTLELDLASIEPGIAGPRRPQDRLSLHQVKKSFHDALPLPKNEGGFAVNPSDINRIASLNIDGKQTRLKHGSVVIAAITSCTNTSNPYVMIAAGLLAKKAVEKGLKVSPAIKTSLTPGSRVVNDYLESAGLLKPLAELGFNVVGFGCATCIGNTGPLRDEVVNAINENGLIAAAVLSGNRNFEGRVSPYTQANYLASPPLVVAYALAGAVTIDFDNEPIGTGKDGKPVYLRDIFPDASEINLIIQNHVLPQMYKARYKDVLTGNPAWNTIKSVEGALYQWSPESTYLQEPPFFEDLKTESTPIRDIEGARALAVFGDSITTDHISPAGDISPKSAAGKYLLDLGVPISDFNSYGARRGNDRVLTRGAFANTRLKNQMVPGVEGSYTLHLPDGEQMSIYDAAMRYKTDGIPLIVLAGKEYGTGSSRDWAAKGPLLLGVKAVIAESFERIHRSNLVGMGVLPLQFKPGENAKSLGLTGREVYNIHGLANGVSPGCTLTATAIKEDGAQVVFEVKARIDTPVEMDYYHNGGIMQTVIKKLQAAPTK
jgi:aconitate hydratase